MNPRFGLRLAGAMVCLLGLISLSSTAAEDQTSVPSSSPPPWQQAPKAPAGAPNIVLVLLDDVGFAASSSFGGPADTPFLDRLAAQGLRYIDFNNTALCSPTRAALLSGRNHHKVGFGTVSEINNPYPGYNSFWPKSVVSLPEMLRRNGYSTAAFGKWHNTPLWEVSPVGPFDRWPTGLGFEYFYGFMQGEASQWEPPLYRNTTAVDPGMTPKDGYYLTTDLVDDAVRWVQTHDSIAPQKPYFLYFATGATHAPHHVPADWIAKYKGKFDGGWDKLNAEIFERQKKLGVIPANTVRTPRDPNLPAWDSLTADQKRLYARQMEVYSAYMAATDYQIGRLVDAIQKEPNGQNTLILYIVGDNGASVEGGPDGSDENMATYAGIPDDVQKQLSRSDHLGGPDLDNILDKEWAFALNTPFKGAKGDASHFGGTRSPLIVAWPAKIKDAGAIRPQFAHVNDIAPTIYDLIGISLPKDVDGVQQAPLDGVSFAPTLFDPRAPSEHHVQYFEMFGNRAIYKDGWVAAAPHGSIFAGLNRSTDFAHDAWELYHVDDDFSEAKDVASKYPDKLKELELLFDGEARRNQVYPLSLADIGGLFPGSSRPYFANDRTEFVFHGGLPRIPTNQLPSFARSHRITASLEIPVGGASGVIMADGGRYGGFSLYAKEGRLVYEQNFFGDERSIITSTMPLPSGKVDVAFEFQRTNQAKWGGGTGKLFINGKPAGEGEIPKVGFASEIDTFDVGADRGSPVSASYAAPAAFNGKVDEIRIDLQ
ncbi:MAG TPA: arylsulfatase [Alphaproteobacteria bacterium]|nr:arylsulfatase [Alphaproteobacteria bacterium]